MSAPQAEIKSIKKQLFKLLENDDSASVLNLLQSLESDPHFNDYLNVRDKEKTRFYTV